MSQFKLLQEHVALLDAAVNHPKAEVKSYEKLIEKLLYFRENLNNEELTSMDKELISMEVDKRLQALHLTKYSMSLILKGHDQLKQENKDVLDLRDRLFLNQRLLVEHKEALANLLVNPLFKKVKTMDRAYQVNHPFVCIHSPRQYQKQKTLAALAKEIHSMLHALTTLNKPMRAFIPKLETLNRLVSLPGLRSRGFFFWLFPWLAGTTTSKTYNTLKKDLGVLTEGYNATKLLEDEHRRLMGIMSGDKYASHGRDSGPKPGLREHAGRQVINY